MQDRQYHTRDVIVHANGWAFAQAEIWAAVDHAEACGFTLDEIQRALGTDHCGAIVTLVLRHHAELQALARRRS
jgi:hypothetical protein